MTSSSQLAKHLREVYFGGNWTWSNLRDQLKDVTLEQATTKVHSFNTIAVLTYHIHYYVVSITNVLEGNMLTSKDEESFEHPPLHHENDWRSFQEEVFASAEKLALLIENLPDEKLWELFVHQKYGIYYRNLFGLIEHTHYHLGQIALIRKWVLSQ